jgi:hypothetical protein
MINIRIRNYVYRKKVVPYFIENLETQLNIGNHHSTTPQLLDRNYIAARCAPVFSASKV